MGERREEEGGRRHAGRGKEMRLFSRNPSRLEHHARHPHTHHLQKTQQSTQRPGLVELDISLVLVLVLVLLAHSLALALALLPIPILILIHLHAPVLVLVLLAPTPDTLHAPHAPDTLHARTRHGHLGLGLRRQSGWEDIMCGEKSWMH